MSFLSTLFSGGDAVKVVGETVQSLFTDDDKRAKQLETFKAQIAHDEKMAELDNSIAVGQIEVNKIEAANTSIFVSGWRPFCGWICALALAYSYLIEPIARFVAKVFFDYTGEFPVVDLSALYPLLFGMLGLGTMRSYDKAKGTSK